MYVKSPESTVLFDFDYRNFYNGTVIENWTELVIGALVLISPWILGFAEFTLARWANVLCGTALVVINVWEIYGKDPVVVGSALVEEEKEKKARPKVKRVRRKKVEQLLTNI